MTNQTEEKSGLPMPIVAGVIVVILLAVAFYFYKASTPEQNGRVHQASEFSGMAAPAKSPR